MNLEILVRYHDNNPSSDIHPEYKPSEHPLQFFSNGDWIDLYAANRYCFRKGDYRLINLGVSIKLPEGYEALIIPRSSTFRKYGILQANSIGLIDNSYCGDEDIWYFPAYATRDTVIEAGDRICQFRIIENQPKVNIEVVSKLINENRGGFGSTGR